jgi:hypothetical protein
MLLITEQQENIFPIEKDNPCSVVVCWHESKKTIKQKVAAGREDVHHCEMSLIHITFC